MNQTDLKMAVLIRNSRLLAGICARVTAKQCEVARVAISATLPKKSFEWRQSLYCSGDAPPPTPQMRLPEATKMQLQYISRKLKYLF